MTDTSKEAVLDAAQRFIDHYFNNPDTNRPEITVPAKESNSDLVLVNGIEALRAELDEAKAEIERLRGVLGKDEARIDRLIEKLGNGSLPMAIGTWVAGWKFEIQDALKGSSQ